MTSVSSASETASPRRRFAATFAKGCAWRALYVSRMADNIDFAGRDLGRSLHQFFHVGIDPDTLSGNGPALFGGFVNPWNRRGFACRWRIRLPHLRWKHNAGPLRCVAYRISSQFWHALDGRFGSLRPGIFFRLRQRLNDIEQRRPLLFAIGVIVAADSFLCVTLAIGSPFA